MYPYNQEGFFSFIISLWQRLIFFLLGLIDKNDLVTEDLQFIALIVSGLIGLGIGFYLVYNNLTMVANSLSHTVLLGLILSFLFFKQFYGSLSVDNLPFYIQAIASILTAIITLISLRYLSQRMSNQAANALSFTALFATGILLSSVLLKDTHLGLESVLGNLEAIQFQDITNLFYALLVTLGFIFFFNLRLGLVSFDAVFAKTVGVKPSRYMFFLILMSSMSLMICFRSLGVIMILSLLTSPVLIGKLFYEDRKKIFLLGICIVLFQATLSLAIVQALYVYFEIPVSTSGVFGSLGLINYAFASFIQKKIALSFDKATRNPN
jgi:manganese/zinc/iron transport system permease protein